MSSNDSDDKQPNATTKGGGQATLRKMFIRVAARVVKENKFTCNEMREVIELARKRGCKTWKINSTSWRRAIKN